MHLGIYNNDFLHVSHHTFKTFGESRRCNTIVISTNKYNVRHNSLAVYFEVV